ncbi:unnamed protein product [Closterium sp. NIES-65]|nr:unnamed protein product [Closterium sp. NIES-65]
MRPRLVLLDGFHCLAARVGIYFTHRILSGKPGSEPEICGAACAAHNGSKLRHDPPAGGVVPWPVLLVALVTSLALIVLLHARSAPIPPICMHELEVPRWPGRRAPSREAMNGLDSKSESDSHLAANCRASLCRSLQKWALQGKQREAASIKTLALNESRVAAEDAAAPAAAAAGSLGDAREPPAAAQNAERLRVQHDVALLCSAPWQRAVQGGVDESAWLQSAQQHGFTSAERIARGMESVCRRLRRVQSSLLARGSTCRHWPEPCWPAPGVPFSRSALRWLDPRARRRYLVFAMSEEQLSNARSHLVEAARVARMANRILVLPLVRERGSNSRIDLSQPLPLCAYWDLAPLDAAPWISPELFLLLARAALKEPSVGFTWVMSPNHNRSPFDWDMASAFTGELLTFALGHVPTENNTVVLNMPANTGDIWELVRNQQDKDVVLWFKTTWERVDMYPCTDDISLRLLPYKHEWHYLAARIAQHLPERFLAVHFRSEFIAFRVKSDNQLLPNGRGNATTLEQQMQWCTDSAAQHINKVKRQHNITAVFIAADVPYNASSAPLRSSSWGYLEWLFDTPITGMAAQQLHWLRSRVNGTVMIDELIPALNSYDPGVVAIVDKLVCAQAAILLAGPTWSDGEWISLHFLLPLLHLALKNCDGGLGGQNRACADNFSSFCMGKEAIGKEKCDDLCDFGCGHVWGGEGQFCKPVRRLDEMEGGG